MGRREPVLEALARINLADPDQPGGIHGGVQDAARIIHEDVENAYTGYPADILPLPATTERPAA